jgi:arylsulfatase A-like enzyme
MESMPTSAQVRAALLLSFALAPGCGGGGSSAPSPEATGARLGTRVVLVTLDTLRLDSFAGLEDGTLQMPRTVDWARRGAVFESYYSVSSTTMPAHASMFSGLYPWEHGATANGLVFAQRHQTVAEILQARGFRTGAVVASFPLHGRFGLDQGFDVYHNEFGQPGQDFSGVEIEDDREGDLHSAAERINARAFELLDDLGGRDQFLWFHYFDAHAPYGDSVEPESNWFPRVLVQRLQEFPQELEQILSQSREKYGQDVAYLDRQLEALFARLDADRERYETHVIVVSDHGEAFGEGGTLGHGKRLVKVQVHVPLFIVSPRVQPGFRSGPVSSVDVAPTLLALSGLRDAGVPGGLDLTAPGRNPTREVFGMRRTFEDSCTEFRTDGTTHVLEDFQFFAAGSDSFLVGDSRRVTIGDSDRELKSGRRGERYSELFDGFQRSLAALPVTELDEASRQALEQLGYTQ